MEFNSKKSTEKQIMATRHLTFSTPQVNTRRQMMMSDGESGNAGNLIAGGIPILVNNKLPLTFTITNAESMNKSFTVKIILLFA